VWQNVTTPVFSKDGDVNFSANELQMIEQIWKCVAEDFAPFNVNVTTVEPAEFERGSGLRVAIGGGWEDWYFEEVGGTSIEKSYVIEELVNTVYVFSDEFSHPVLAARRIADAATHEAGHAFGLDHQSVKVDGVTTEEYNPGTSEKAPLMGISYNAERSIWWTSPAGLYGEQNDINRLLTGANFIDFRTDDHGGTIETATAINYGDEPVHGVIASNATNVMQGDDVDAFIVNLPENGFMKSWNVSVGGERYSTNLDVRLEVYRVEGDSLTSIGISDDDASLDARVGFVGAGQYLIMVKSHGEFGDLGQYTLNVSQHSAPLPSAQLYRLPPLIDIVCDPLGPIQHPGLIVSASLEPLRVDRLASVSAVTAVKSPVAATTNLNGKGGTAKRVVAATSQANSLAHDLAFESFGLAL
jgi:hypothetical protein